MRSHGGDVYKVSPNYDRITDMSSNVNPFLDLGKYSLYPEISYTDIEEKLRVYTKSTNMGIVIGPGLTHLIYKYFEFYQVKKPIIAMPNFSEYKGIAEDRHLRFSAIPSYIIEKDPLILKNFDHDALFITSPSNPFGELFPESTLETVFEIEEKRGRRVFLDGAFMDFVPNYAESIVQSSRSYFNVTIGRSLTKILAIPSLRAGYLIMERHEADLFRKAMEPWSICQPAIDFIRSIDINEVAKNSVALVNGEREYLISELKARGIKVIGNPSANYIVISMPRTDEFYNFMLSKGILVRLLDDYDYVGRCLVRLAIKTRSQNNAFLNALDNFMSSSE
ncbi:ribonucleotide reductase [Thermoplasma volcanium GSS1]|uniref:Ribonucleotide reductase n=1 Tax=Thermoplasma volcanium (strain ATCC 51530 / DSM 4299 / JCM 9571 / NBRC 15438 / GSS1) TaxID=273116 RepID=Q97CM4_THEVO|nr:aminotransferase class I/II-fold pyridoxal phosphate-dependent enzyme [Thermoplasma volcanium]BAB59219.1 ribonucleotide reductase [Thermoplasma volcanium GSS1]